MSPRTAFLGKLLGLYCIAISLAMLAHPQATVEIMLAIVQNGPLLFVCGLLGFTAGLAIVLVHNRLSGSALAVVVTIFGWAALIKGALLLLLSPETQRAIFFVGFGYQRHPSVYAVLLLLFGAYMTYAGFSCKARAAQP